MNGPTRRWLEDPSIYVSRCVDGAAVMTGCLTQLLRQFRSSCPDVELSLQEVPPDKQCAAIVDGELDVGLSPNYKPGLPPGLTSIPVGSWPLTFAMASDRGDDAGKILLEQCATLDADLLVMGAVARPRIGEVIFGSASKTVLSEASLPLLLSS